MSMKVRKACENNGFFLLRCDDEVNSIEELFKSVKTLFHLPQQTKQQHISPTTFSSFSVHKFMNTVYECFAIDDVLLSTSVENFTNLMWPQGNPNFCEVLKDMSLKMTEISSLVLKMIVEGYGIPKHYISDVENMKSCTQIRLNMYNIDPNKGASNGHTDKDTLTVLCQNEVQGLQMLSKSGKWVDVEIPQNCFVVIVGDALKAWSNERLHVATHRVMMNGEKERFIFRNFVTPKDEMKIEVPDELVDDKIHPLRYRPFNYGEFISHFVSTRNHNAVDVFTSL